MTSPRKARNKKAKSQQYACHAMPCHGNREGRGGAGDFIRNRGLHRCDVRRRLDLFIFFAGTERIVGYIVPKGNLTYGRVPYLWVRKVLR